MHVEVEKPKSIMKKSEKTHNKQWVLHISYLQILNAGAHWRSINGAAT